MTTPVNLNKARKKQNARSEKSKADANSAKFGQTKAQKTLDKTRESKMQRSLNGARIERE